MGGGAGEPVSVLLAADTPEPDRIEPGGLAHHGFAAHQHAWPDQEVQGITSSDLKSNFRSSIWSLGFFFSTRGSR